VVLGAWLAYKQSQKLQQATAAKGTSYGQRGGGQRWTPKPGSTGTMYAGFGATSQLSKSGNNSPGSGIQAMQPALASTWSIGGKYGIGRIGVTYK
jgi:hypothetical protein